MVRLCLLTPSRKERHEVELLSAPQAPVQRLDWRCAPKDKLQRLGGLA